MGSENREKSVAGLPRRAIAAAALLELAVLAVPVNAQKTISYGEYRFGFDVQLPGEWSYDRSRFVGPNDSIGLLQGASRSGHRTLQITIHRTLQPTRFVENEVSAFEKRLAAVPGTLSCKSRLRTTPRGSELLLTADSNIGGVAVRRFYHCVNIDEQTVYVLAVAAVGGDPNDLALAEQELNAAAQSLRITYRPEAEAVVGDAIRRGEALAAQVRERRIADVQPDERERYYQIDINGKPVGYFSSSLQHRTRREGGRERPGLRLRERGWTFLNGGAQQTRIDSFLSHDGLTELIETQITYYPPLDSQGETVVALDQCVREGDSLVTSFSVSNRPEAQTRTPVGTSGGYVALAWTRRLGELLGREAGELRGLQVYDAEMRGLGTVWARCVGKREVPGTGERATAYEWREGFAPTASMHYVDREGRLIRSESGPTTVTAVPATVVEERFKGLREGFERRWKAGGGAGSP